jgi:hypothetical protein
MMSEVAAVMPKRMVDGEKHGRRQFEPSLGTTGA